MDLSTEIVGGIVTIATGLGTGVRWAAGRFTKLERDLRDSHATALAECKTREEALLTRLVALEDRSHEEDREDRRIMLNTLQLNAQAFQKLTERLPDNSPPEGNRLHSSTLTPPSDHRR